MSFWDRFRNNNNRNRNRPSGNPRGNLKGQKGAPKQPVYNPLSGGSANTGRRVVRRLQDNDRSGSGGGGFLRAEAGTNPDAPGFWGSAGQFDRQAVDARGPLGQLARLGDVATNPLARKTIDLLPDRWRRQYYSGRFTQQTPNPQGRLAMRDADTTRQELDRFFGRRRDVNQLDPSLRITNPYDQTPPSYSGDVRQGRNPPLGSQPYLPANLQQPQTPFGRPGQNRPYAFGGDTRQGSVPQPGQLDRGAPIQSGDVRQGNPNLGGQPQMPAHLQQLQTLLGRPGQNRPYAFGGDTRQGSVPQPGQFDTSAPRASLDVRQGNPNVLGAGLASPQAPLGVARPEFPGGVNQPGVAERSDVRGTNLDVVNPYAQEQRGDDWASQFAHLLQGQQQTDWGSRPGEVAGLGAAAGNPYAGGVAQPMASASQAYLPSSQVRSPYQSVPQQRPGQVTPGHVSGPAAPVASVGGGRVPMTSDQIQGILDKYRSAPGGNVQLTPEDRESILYTLNAYRANQYSAPGGGQVQPGTTGGISVGEDQTDDWGGQINPGGAGPGGLDPAPGPGLPGGGGFAKSPDELPLTQQQLMALYRNSLNAEELADFDAKYFKDPTQEQFEAFRAQQDLAGGAPQVQAGGMPIYNLVPYAGFGRRRWGGAGRY